MSSKRYPSRFESRAGFFASTRDECLSPGCVWNEDLSSETGLSASAVSEAAYSAISAGQSTGDALEFVATAAKLAKGGFTDVSTATDVLTTALNAYGLSADQVTHVSDVLIETQNEGKTTVAELASAMGKVIPTAAAAGVGIEDLSSQYVALTKNGIATAEATTYINGMLNELTKNGSSAFNAFKEAAGVTFPEYIAQGHQGYGFFCGHVWM